MPDLAWASTTESGRWQLGNSGVVVLAQGSEHPRKWVCSEDGAEQPHRTLPRRWSWEVGSGEGLREPAL